MKFVPAEHGSRYPSIVWGPESTHWTGEKDKHREHSIIWCWEPRDFLVGVNWYRSSYGRPFFTFEIHLPFWRIWYKYEGASK